MSDIAGTDPVIRRYSPDGIAPPVGAYSHLASVAGPAEWVFISGQVGADRSGAVPDEIAGQTRNTLRNMETLICAAGGTPRSMVRLMSFVVGAERVPAYAAVRNEIFAEWFPDGDLPGHSLAVIAGLAQPHLLVEIEGWIALPRRD